MMGFHVPIVGFSRQASFPAVESRATSQLNSAGTSHTVTMPSGIVAGDRLVVCFQTKDAQTVTFPANWVGLPSNDSRQHVFYKTADGTEGASINVTTSGSNRSSHMSYRISGWQGTPEQGIGATGSDANPNPPSLTPSWGSKKTLWLVFAGQGGSSRSYSAAPTNYTNLQQEVPTDTASASAERLLETTTEDPGTFTMSGSSPWWTQTVAIQGV